MSLRFDKRLRILEVAKNVAKKPDFSGVSPADLRKWREIATAAADLGDWSNFFDDLAAHAPSVYAAYRKAENR